MHAETITDGCYPTRNVHYWGRYDTPGLLLRAPRPDETTPRCYCSIGCLGVQGGTWGLFGVTRDNHETPSETAVREEARPHCGATRGTVDIGDGQSLRAPNYYLDPYHGCC